MPITPLLPAPPLDGAPVNAACESPDMLQVMALRRSTKIAHLAAPGPDQGQIEALLRLAARAPDHGKLAPWRFIVIAQEGRSRAGAAVAAALGSEGEAWRGMFERAPMCVVVVSCATPHPKIPEWEQILSAGAVCYGLLLAAHASGFAGCWLTEAPSYDARARRALGLREEERIAGMIYLGTAAHPASERSRKAAREVTTFF